MSFAIGTVNFLVGSATAVSPEGIERNLQLGDTVMNDEVVTVASGGEIEIVLSNGESVSLSDGTSWVGANALTPETLAILEALTPSDQVNNLLGDLLADADVPGSDAGPIGTVNAVVGSVVAVDDQGNERVLQPGDAIYADETVRSGPDGFVELSVLGSDGQPIVVADGQSWLATSDSYTPNTELDSSTTVASDVDALQQAILAGVDPTQVR
jgi:uncharacterized cupin superfamily protein